MKALKCLCGYCGKHTTKRFERMYFCNNTCKVLCFRKKSRKYRNVVDKECLYCGEMIHRDINEKIKYRKYCSEECSVLAHKQNILIYNQKVEYQKQLHNQEWRQLSDEEQAKELEDLRVKIMRGEVQ